MIRTIVTCDKCGQEVDNYARISGEACQLPGWEGIRELCKPCVRRFQEELLERQRTKPVSLAEAS